MAAPTLVAFAANEATVASGANVTTASISWQINDVVVVLAGDAGPASGALQTPTTTGSGLTFTNQRIHNAAGSDCGGGIWTAVASANSSGTVSINDTLSSSAGVAIGVYVFRGSAGVGNSNISTGSSRTVSLTPAGGADASIAWCVFDWNADTAQTFTPSATSHSNVAPGPTASPVSTQVGTSFTYYFADLDDQTGTGSVNYGVGGSNTGPYTIVAIEVKAGTGGAPSGSSPQAMPPAAPWLGPPALHIAPQFYGDRTSIFGYLSDGTTVNTTSTITASGQATGSASLTITETGTATGGLSSSQPAALTVTSSITATGDATGQAALTITETTTAAGGGSSSQPASLTVTDTITASGSGTGQATVSTTDTITAVATATGQAALTETCTITAAGSLGISTGASLTITVSDIAAGNSSANIDPNQASIQVAPMFLNLRNSDFRFQQDSTAPNAAFTGTASLTATATSTATGQPTGDVSLSITDAITATGAPSGMASLTVTATILAAGSLPGSSGATDTITATITAAGTVATASGASLTVTASRTSAGDATGQATRTTTATITTGGQPLGSIAHVVTALITAVGKVATASGATLTITDTIGASGVIPSAGMTGNVHGPGSATLTGNVHGPTSSGMGGAIR